MEPVITPLMTDVGLTLSNLIRMMRKNVIDTVAACIILESYLNSLKN